MAMNDLAAWLTQVLKEEAAGYAESHEEDCESYYAHECDCLFRDMRARIAADRQILEAATKAIADAPERGYDWESEWARAKAVAYENVLRLKAASYADRPGYQEAWRPS